MLSEPAPPATGAVRRAWARRITSEYAAGAQAAELLHWLVVLGVSPDTLDDAQRLVRDELQHAEMARDVYLAAGGDLASHALPREALWLDHDPEAPFPLRVLSAAADTLCIGESVACAAFQALREVTTASPARETIERILADEANHRRLGWTLLDELLESFGEAGRAWLRPRVPAWCERVQAGYVRGGAAAYTPDEIAWGLLPASRYRALTAQAIEQVVLPRFAARGIGG